MATIQRLAVTCFHRIPCVLPGNFLISVRRATKLVSSEYLHLTPKPEITEREPIEYEISKSPTEWEFVERLIPPKVVPEPIVKREYPSGWRPQENGVPAQPYFVERSKNHMPGVYLVKDLRGQRIRTKIRKVSGDIWALEHDIKTYLKEKHQKRVVTHIHEITRCIWFKGDYYNDILQWMLERGLC